jgi:hypothetical protein
LRAKELLLVAATFGRLPCPRRGVNMPGSFKATAGWRKLAVRCVVGASSRTVRSLAQARRSLAQARRSLRRWDDLPFDAAR